ncbi:glycine--tRNA ligase subunit beta [Pontivivens nitratireducens]|uniref:Glycine--tRNA ligase beta subunit n=1 Tax=Pontivivens nitratireducens TaxID=2758038 RepID=A0A6G7VLD0_9RHOB|nr:glycine--tRNA ligase subunit beta [Pontibrevibacter nitratireducens]QIK40742.1 glycine--tRNA ligase subunit beta [Pontibrevibacter nitratireducens]
MSDLLIELFSEEIPARMQAKAADDLRRLMTDGMVEAGLTYGGAAAFATPRRLTLAVEGLTDESPTVREERKGPRTDAPEKALAGFLRSTGLTKDQLEVRDDKKGQVYFAVIEKPGRPAAQIVAETLESTIRNFPWPKSMRWGSGSLRWVRPLHSILAILTDEEGAQVVPLDIDGIASGDTTRGHRFMAPDTIKVTSFEDYASKLKRAHVILDAKERADIIWGEATNMAFAQGLEIVEDKGLLAEVAGLVEWPVPLMGSIGEQFLDLPPEVLQTSMKEHQKFFSVRDHAGKIVKYVTVANRTTADDGTTILAGNGKVLTARLSDAKFFWENDLQTVRERGLQGMAAPLANVTFHNKLGSQAERIARIAALAREIAPLVGADADMAEQAAQIAKADLSSEMVYEFPELQGLMGRYYAEAAGLPQEVANAAQYHYSPLGPSDDVPREPVSVAVALADKLDTLTGFWAIDEKPTGSKDPYALRRAALGVIRLILSSGARNNWEGLFLALIFAHLSGRKVLDVAAELESETGEASVTLKRSEVIQSEVKKIMSLDVPDLVLSALQADRDRTANARENIILLKGWMDTTRVEASNLLSFFADRLKVHLRAEGIRHDVIDAALPENWDGDIVLLVNRVRALQAFLDTEDGANLLAAYTRASNILRAEEAKDGVEYSLDPNPDLAENDSEKALFAALDVTDPQIDAGLAAEDFAAAMAAIAALRGPLDAYFEATLINSDNQIIRRNRLCLLNRIRTLFARIADFGRIEG